MGVAIRDLSRADQGTTMSERKPKHFFVYITASGPRGVLYVGVTSDLPGRAWQHRERVIAGFTKRYWAGRLVYFESHASAESALARDEAVAAGLEDRARRDRKSDLG